MTSANGHRAHLSFELGHAARFALFVVLTLFVGARVGHGIALLIETRDRPPELHHLTQGETRRIIELSGGSAARRSPAEKRAIVVAVTKRDAMVKPPPESVFDAAVRHSVSLRRAELAGRLVALLLAAAFLAPYTRRIAYRPVDALWLLVPLYGEVFALKMLWRLAAARPYWSLPR